jgi:Ser/Thr protein kinase RdoA (MazF antagonist)
MDVGALRTIHELQRIGRAAGVPFVPDVIAANTRQTTVDCHGRTWDVTTWMPGRADFETDPNRARLANACAALAQLHAAWTGRATAPAPCPAVQRRLVRLRECDGLLQSGWRPAFSACDDHTLRYWGERAYACLPRFLEPSRQALAVWASIAVPIQPCLCDVWHDHVLFEGDRISGIVDYGSVKPDNVAVDLARLLGSLIGDDDRLRAVGLDAYRAAGGALPPRADELIAALDRTGTVLGAANWLRWLFLERRMYEDLSQVARRLRALVERMEKW